jgi:soluble lytic murein transglycosylase-like protein
MKIATGLTRGSRILSAFAKHLAHGGLLAMGALSIAGVLASAIAHERPVLPMPVALNAAHAGAIEAELDPAIDTHFDLAVARMLDGKANRRKATAARALSPELERVKRYVARRYRVSSHALETPIARAQRSAAELDLDPLLIVAVMAIESSFNPLAESSVGAQGLMQVIPRFHMDKIGPGAKEGALFDPDTNVRVGALVIKEGLRRYGSLQRALQYYGGALADPNARYARKVLAMKARLEKVAADEA